MFVRTLCAAERIVRFKAFFLRLHGPRKREDGRRIYVFEQQQSLSSNLRNLIHLVAHVCRLTRMCSESGYSDDDAAADKDSSILFACAGAAAIRAGENGGVRRSGLNTLNGEKLSKALIPS